MSVSPPPPNLTDQQIADNLRAVARSRRRSKATQLLEAVAQMYEDEAKGQTDGA